MRLNCYFQNTCKGYYELDPKCSEHFSTCPLFSDLMALDMRNTKYILYSTPQAEIREGVGACDISTIERLNEDMKPVQDGNAGRGL